MKKYVRFITPSSLTCVGDATDSGSFAKAAKIEMLNVKTFSTGEAATSKISSCRHSIKQLFLKISQKFTRKHLC